MNSRGKACRGPVTRASALLAACLAAWLGAAPASAAAQAAPAEDADAGEIRRLLDAAELARREGLSGLTEFAQRGQQA